MKWFGGVLLVIAVVLFALIGCEFRVEEYRVPTPPTGITVLADDEVIAENLLILQEGEVRPLNAVVAGGNNDVNITWLITHGDDVIQLTGNHGESVTVNVLDAGDARVSVRAENIDGAVEVFVDIIVSGADPREWIFRAFENSPSGLREVADGAEFDSLVNEEAIIQLVVVGETVGTVSFSVTSGDTTRASVLEVRPDVWIVTGYVPRQRVPITVTATVGGQTLTRTFLIRILGSHPIPPLHWNNSTDPSPMLFSGLLGSAQPIAGTPYFFRLSGQSNQVPVTADGAFILGTVYPYSALIVGGGNSMEAPHPGYTRMDGANNPNNNILVPGQINLSNDATYRLVIEYSGVICSGVDDEPNQGGDFLLRITVNNTTFGGAGGLLGGRSELVSFWTEERLNTGNRNRGIVTDFTGTEPGRLVMYFNPVELWINPTGVPPVSALARTSLENAFITIVTLGFNQRQRVIINGISLEQLLCEF